MASERTNERTRFHPAAIPGDNDDDVTVFCVYQKEAELMIIYAALYAATALCKH